MSLASGSPASDAAVDLRPWVMLVQGGFSKEDPHRRSAARKALQIQLCGPAG